MKQLIQLNITLIIIFFTACTPQIQPEISHKSDINKGFLQKHLDEWFKYEWEPSVKKKDIQTKERLKLQDYIDKFSLYMQTHTDDANISHIKRLEMMPVIGN